MDNYKYAKLSCKKLNKKEKLCFKKKFAENKSNLKELWRTSKALGMPSKGGGQTKVSLRKNGVVSFVTKKNANSFSSFFFKVSRNITTKTSTSKK